MKAATCVNPENQSRNNTRAPLTGMCKPSETDRPSTALSCNHALLLKSPTMMKHLASD